MLAAGVIARPAVCVSLLFETMTLTTAGSNPPQATAGAPPSSDDLDLGELPELPWGAAITALPAKWRILTRSYARSARLSGIAHRLLTRARWRGLMAEELSLTRGRTLAPAD